MAFRTQRDVDRLTLPKGKTEHIEFDELCRGLGVRLQGDAKVWLVRYQLPGGERRKFKLADVAAMSLATAREQASRIVAGAKDGRDPQHQRRARKAQAADTFGALVEIYLARYAAREQRPRTLVETTRALRVHLASLHSRPLAELSRRDVAAHLMALVDTSGPIMANRTRAAVSHAFAWAMQQGLAESNPVIGTARPAPETKRERTLSPDELRTVWNAAGDDDYGRIVKLLILTGQRREEVGGMSEAELDRAGHLWVLPAARTKNGREHEVPLPPLALQLIGPARDGQKHVFGRGRRGFSGWSQGKARLDERVAMARASGRLGRPLDADEKPDPADGLPGWTLHDLRRTFVTIMNDRGIALPHVIEAVVNHVGGAGKAGVAGVYNRAKYATEKRAALQRWADFVEALVCGEERQNVIVLGRGAR